MAKTDDSNLDAAIREMLDGDTGEDMKDPLDLSGLDENGEVIEEDKTETPEARGAAADDAVSAEMDQLRAERDDMRDRFMRALADAENARKRSERDRKEAENYGGSKLSRDMLPVYDNLKRALDSVTDEQKAANKALLEGIELTQRELLNVFAKHGINRISPKVGDRFDPQKHQAMFEAPVPGTKAGDIIQVAAEGFMLHDRLLRAAQVGLSSTPKVKEG